MIGNRIKESREKAGFTQDEFCKKIDKSKRTLLNYEKNESEPSVKTARLIAKICNIDEFWLLTGNEKISNIHYEEELLKTIKKLKKEDIQYLYHVAKSKELE